MMMDASPPGNPNASASGLGLGLGAGAGAGERYDTSDGLGDKYKYEAISPKDQIISPHGDADAASSALVPSASGHAASFQPFSGGSGFGSSTATWNGYQQYLNADGLHVVSPVVYNENPSLVFHSGYGFNTDITYGQYSPLATTLPPLMVDGQLYSAQQLPFSPPYFPQPPLPNMPHISSAVPVSPTELMTPESTSIDSMFFGPGSGFLVNFGSLAGGNLSGNINSSPVASPTVYPQPMGILGSYENNFGQVSQQQRSRHGFGLVSTSQYAHGGSYQSSSFGGVSFPYSVPNELNQLSFDKGRRERDQDSISISNDSRDIFNDRNRGPRASKVKGKSATEQSSSSGGNKKNLSASGILLDSFNRLDFVADYEDAKFFIIKSFSEDNVHKSIKYSVWASTPHGNKKLDAAYQEAKKIKPNSPVFLFFSVNASGQFCGVAEMVGPVNFDKDAEYWQQDRWSGQFPVQWHIVKDVPNIRFRHIVLDNNDNKPVTHSRDSQEVGFKQGIEMLKIFKDHDARTSILDDFFFYDDREKALRERKARHQAFAITDATDNISHEMSEALEGNNKMVASVHGVSSTCSNHESLNQLSDSLSQRLVLEDNDKGLAVYDLGLGSEVQCESVDKETSGMAAAASSSV